MAKKNLSNLELLLKKQAILSKNYTDEQIAARSESDKVYLIEQGTAEQGYLKTYILANGVNNENSVVASGAGKNLIGKINIPKDFLVKSGSLEQTWLADDPYEGAAEGDRYLDFTINSLDSSTGEGSHIYIPLRDIMPKYYQGDGLYFENDGEGGTNIHVQLTQYSGLYFSNDGLGILIDESNRNGLIIDDSTGLGLNLATTSLAGAMSAADKTKLDKALTSDDIALLSNAELGSWFGYAADSSMVTTTLAGVSQASITDEA